MGCSVCNGGGYVVGKGRESIRSECQGRGERFFIESDRLRTQESHSFF